MRVLLTWELGLNLGHLTRLLPVAQQLKRDGHTVLIAVRDIQAAATVLGQWGIPFVQAPHLPNGIPLSHRATGYADILLSQGWSDKSALWGLAQGWLNIFQLFRPDKLILDYSPTVSLAARIAKIPSVLVGNGFELPPLATFPTLDHYAEREDAEYIGPLLGHLNAPSVDWPEGRGPKIFACLRPDTARAQEILAALAAITARVVCVAGGFAKAQLEPYQKNHIRYSLGPLDLQPQLDADLCISYGAEGTMMRFLLAGVPQCISPWHVETFMAARRIEASGFGVALTGMPAGRLVREEIERVASDGAIRQRVKLFAAHEATFGAGRAVTAVTETLVSQNKKRATRLKVQVQHATATTE
jgi:UDP:flavonoid glycosyltransferase YjiC (YdhE family)